ncbi:monosaccharide-transporting ATPase [Eubacteriales bacterium]|nr:sugar ABC transporter ATP-binding protein [Faecalicatena sp. BF-R-105]GKH52365.1 monosaccharide-transporting ATPase [Eubacteriales bacterium]GKH65085.1 monosaccharide-transporting ATPase [Eubacteriales bacterium]
MKFLEMAHITKKFSGVTVLKDVHLDIEAGEVHALMGENGAGKSTLMKILAGIYACDEGEIRINGETVVIHDTIAARNQGINFIHQEICLAENMSIAENLYIGMEIKKGLFLDKKKMVEITQEHLNALGLDLDANTQVSTLSIAQKQMVEIARALFFDAKLVVMDEPTSSLTNKEVDSLFEQVELLKQKQVAIVYISHRMEEIFKIADRVTVLRDGQYIGTKNICDIDMQKLISMMVGRGISQERMDVPNGSDSILQVRNFCNRYLKDVSFDLKRGEVLGFAGLVGAGRTELAYAIFGIDPLDSGELILDGKKVVHKSPQDSIRNGVVLVPEDRKQYGLVTSLSVKFNLTLPILYKFIKGIRVDTEKERKIIDNYANKLAIKMSGVDQICAGLSGGNQQKVVISKWLASEPSVIILDEPTRGIDIGAKQDIYNLIKELAEQGLSIILISSELPEILKMSSRVAVMHEGELEHIFESVEGVTQEQIMYYAVGGK